jgi:streptogramin lyase
MKSPLIGRFFLAAFLVTGILAGSGCGKDDAAATTVILPVVITDGLISNLTATTAQSGGIVTSDGGGEILAQGVCYSSSDPTPTVSDTKTNDKSSIDEANTQSFTSSLTVLTTGSTYYVRAYATNSAGTAYGNVVKFTATAVIASLIATVTTFAGSATAGYLNGSGAGAQFSGPQGVAADASGNVYVADNFNNVIREISPSGVVTTFAGDGNPGYTDGPAASAEFYGPQAIAIDAQGNLYVCDVGNSVIRKITQAGTVSTFAGNGTRGYINGDVTAAEFNNPQGIAVDASGNVYVADRTTSVIRKISTAGKVITLSGLIPGAYTTNQEESLPIKGYYDGAANISLFNSPEGLAVDASGNVYVADLLNYAIRKLTPAGVSSTYAGGIVQTTVVGSPTALCFDKTGDMYITDQSGRVFEITTGNVIYTLAGTYNVSGFANGIGEYALFNSPEGITVDNNGNVFVADLNNNVIRELVVTTVASAGIKGKQ